MDKKSINRLKRAKDYFYILTTVDNSKPYTSVWTSNLKYAVAMIIHFAKLNETFRKGLISCLLQTFEKDVEEISNTIKKHEHLKEC